MVGGFSIGGRGLSPIMIPSLKVMLRACLDLLVQLGFGFGMALSG